MARRSTDNCSLSRFPLQLLTSSASSCTKDVPYSLLSSALFIWVCVDFSFCSLCTLTRSRIQLIVENWKFCFCPHQFLTAFCFRTLARTSIRCSIQVTSILVVFLKVCIYCFNIKYDSHFGGHTFAKLKKLISIPNLIF